ncbi:uncharacterized protein LOC116601153 [Nematostella vectensis]|uniref:uncharacterized protein LOC116601153 n=1 Tax=Nematostella vectensis TaxID=45351 RepID=UPI0013906D1F|nr:uncharacterized protein LOC116601153 [Nematostella vectensis]
MRLEIAILILSAMICSIYAKEGAKCRDDSECMSRECCAGATAKTYGACQYRPVAGDRCSPLIPPRSTLQCPCEVGSTCSLSFYNPDLEIAKYYCTKIKVAPGEAEITEIKTNFS